MIVLNSLSKRERYIAIAVAAAVLIFLLDQFLLTPYTTLRTDVLNERDTVTKQLVDADRLFQQQREKTKTWKDLSNAIKSNRSLAESQAQQAILDWARVAGANVGSFKPERDITQNGLQVISFHVNCTGSNISLAKLLWSIETATIPIRVNDVQIVPRKEGSDDLNLQMGISTLALLTEAGKTEGSVPR